MEARLQRRVQRYGWDKASGYYEGSWSRQLRPAQERLLELAALQRGETVLDVACGTGLVSIPAAEQVGVAGSVFGTDISENMVAAARSEALRRGLTNISFARMDAEDLEVEDGEFDAALCALGMMYFPDPVRALSEMRRAVKPGGRVVTAVWGERRACGWAGIFPVVDARVESEVCPLFFQLGTRDNMRASFEAAGLEDVDSERIQTILRYDSAEEACGAAFAGGPVALAWSRFDAGTRQAAAAEYLQMIEPYRHGEAYYVPGEFVLTSGRRAEEGAEMNRGASMRRHLTAVGAD